MIGPAHAMKFIGQHVVFRTRDGVTHHGILHSVTNDGIYVRAIGGPSTRLATQSSTEADNIDLLKNLPQSTDDIKESWWPLYFFTWWWLLGLWLWALWW
ncbi:LSm family protein [Alicyclobacillus dauci]|uniref:Uncharacterized protein n=1 Tax=Alicyclobacillus dauci TaxID=1475485 RepID=A0ABY6Z8S4_9BACL|nr:hypothetical protein [Alicyclobacillus dauci]WAH38654.1 hypothetical protein NZD86_09310 [Alicyclobacillus dauci]